MRATMSSNNAVQIESRIDSLLKFCSKTRAFLFEVKLQENLEKHGIDFADAELFHGLPPFSVFAPPRQTCGSARLARNPRYRGGGPPALERKPFRLDGDELSL